MPNEQNQTKTTQQAAQTAVVPSCQTNVTLLSGCYGWIAVGSVGPDSNKVQTKAVGYFNFHDKTVSGSYEGSFGGTPVFKTLSNGNVTSNQNHFGAITITDNEVFVLNFDFVMVDGGKVLYLVNRDAGALQTLTATKV